MKRALPVLACLALVAAACEPGDDGLPKWDGITHETLDDSPPDTTTYDTPTDTSTVDTWGMDRDGDGFSPADGDCDDTEASINPDAYDDPTNDVDDDCDTLRDNPPADCDCGSAPTLLEGMDICDMRFVRSAAELSYTTESAWGRGVSATYGSPTNALTPRQGCVYSILNTGDIEPKTGASGDPDRQPGTDFHNPSGDDFGPWCDAIGLEPDPDPTGGGGIIICDVQQYVIEFTAPSNAVGFQFDFLYLSAEYPEWVDLGYNDTFYAILDRPLTGEHINISFDDYGAEIEVDNAFFQDPPTTDISGTGYTDTCCPILMPCAICGSSTGWLRTSWEIDPGEEFTLTFSIHDEGDGIYDSMVMLDNFLWSIDEVDPGTIII